MEKVNFSRGIEGEITMKVGLLIGLLLSALFVASCSVPNEPVKSASPVLEVETSTAPVERTAQVYQVAIENGNLMPVNIEINAGDTVEWVNKDTVRYTLMLGQFEERLPVGGTFEHIYTETGTVRYIAQVVEEDQEDNQERELHGLVIVN